MTHAEIFARLRDVFVEQFELDAAQITMDAHLFHDLDLDSIDAIDMAVRLQQMIGQRVEEASLRNLRTVCDVVDLVDRHVNAHASAAAGATA